jgi:small-conductance mechanosensitive channel
VEQRPKPVCHITKFDGSAVEYILRFWICDPQNGVTNIRGDVLLACWDAFKAAGFELALETRDLLIRHPVSVQVQGERGEALSDAPAELQGKAGNPL